MYNSKTLEFIKLLIILLPFLLITGPFLPEVVIFMSCLYYIFIALKEKKTSFNNKKFNIFFLIFYISITVSSLFSISFETSIIKSILYVRFFIFFYFINNFFSSKDLERFNISLILAISFVVLDIFFQFIFGQDFFGYYPGMNGLRYQGPFGDEWISGGYLKNFGIIVVTYIFLNYSSKLGKNFSFIALLLILLAIFISGEKMALILFSLFSIFFLIIYLKHFFIHLLVFIIFLIGIGLFINNNKVQTFDSSANKYEKISFRYINQFLSVVGLSKESKTFILDTEHGVHFLTAYEIFKKNKYFGSGIKTFRITCSDIDPKIIANYGVTIRRAVQFRCTSHPHNFLLEILSETGLIGFFGYILFLSYIFLTFYLNFKKDSNLKIPYVFSLMFFIFPFATSGSFFNNYNSLILWIILSFIFFKKKKITD